jgi:predicted nucleic acid-binding Zn ribbon protein
MTFNSLDRILETIEQQSGWEMQQHYRRLLESWTKIVSPVIAQNTRPLYITRQVLWVATSSSVWAQTLSFQRHTLLKQLNTELSQTLLEIRFSSASWHSQSSTLLNSNQPTLTSEHPSVIPSTSESESEKSLHEASTPQTAFQRWTNTIQLRAQNLPLCPQCQCPTPPGELKRWSICACCIAQQWK